MSRRARIVSGCLLLALGATATPYSDALWHDVSLSETIGDLDGALAALAELTMMPLERPLALEKAAYLLLEAGEDKQAASLLEELIAEPGFSHHATTWLALQVKHNEYDHIVEVVQSNPHLPWTERDLALIRISFTEAGLSPPKLQQITPDWSYRLRLTNLAQQIDTADGHDTQTNRSFAVRVERPVADHWHTGLELVRGVERSDDGPTETDEFEVWRTELTLNTRYQQKGTRLQLQLGSVQQSDRMGPLTVDFGDLWTWGLRLRQKVAPWELQISSQRRASLAPTFYGLTVEAVDRQLLSVRRYVGSFRVDVEHRHTAYSHVEDAGSRAASTRDFQATALRAEYYPPALRAFWLSAEYLHEHRDTDEPIARSGLWFSRSIGSKGNVFLGVGYENNLKTEEQLFELNAYRTVHLGKRQLQFGLYANLGVAKRHDRTTFLTLSLRN